MLNSFETGMREERGGEGRGGEGKRGEERGGEGRRGEGRRGEEGVNPDTITLERF